MTPERAVITASGLDRSIYRDAGDRFSACYNDVWLTLRRGYWHVETRERNNRTHLHSRHRKLSIGLDQMERRIHERYANFPQRSALNCEA